MPVSRSTGHSGRAAVGRTRLAPVVSRVVDLGVDLVEPAAGFRVRRHKGQQVVRMALRKQGGKVRRIVRRPSQKVAVATIS